MSDHYTRITNGGSPLPRTAPVVGLLFGSCDETAIVIRDADDIPTDKSETASTQVSLHQAVFPLLRVVGWYRVAAASDSDKEPVTAHDLQLTQQLSKQYCDASDASDANTNTNTFIFALLQVQTSNSNTDELPLTLYKFDNTNATVLQAVKDSKLQTADAERIAVERVMREQPQTSDPRTAANADLQTSVAAIQDRLLMIAKYLQHVQEASSNECASAADLALVRRCQSLLLRPMAPAPVLPTKSNGIQQLALLTTTLDAVQEYADHFRVIHEAAGNASSSSSMSTRMSSREARLY
jgi:hypothetical protein